MSAQFKDFVGKWQEAGEEGYDAFLKAIGVGTIKRNLQVKAKLTIEVTPTSNPDAVDVQYKTALNTQNETWNLGKEFDTTMFDGRLAMKTVTFDGDKGYIVVVSKIGGNQWTENWEIKGDQELVCNYFAGDAQATTSFRRQ